MSASSLDAATHYTLDFVLSALSTGASRILEVGCGAGALAAALQASGHDVIAIDVDSDAVAAAKAAGVDARQARWPDFADGAFDAVLFTRSLHHVDDLKESVAAAFAILSPAGQVIVEDFMAEGEPEISASWFRSLVRLLDSQSAIAAPTPYLAPILGHPFDDHQGHHAQQLFSSAEIEAALRAAGTTTATGAAYYFRYLLPALAKPASGDALLRHELELIASDVIEPLGRRYVANLT